MRSTLSSFNSYYQRGGKEEAWERKGRKEMKDEDGKGKEVKGEESKGQKERRGKERRRKE